jgi:exopolysaccharide biosynthesis WecB/TagA/CpsF family protein
MKRCFVATQQILGIAFFDGDPVEVVEWMIAHGGFLIAPSGTCFARLRRDAVYREAVTHADVALPDSGAMVLLWRFLRGRRLTRISGFKYLRQLSARLFAEKAKLLWVLPNERARQKTAEWLRANRVSFAEGDFYIAPIYGSVVEDRNLLDKLERDQPQHVIVAIGSGPQEKLGYYLRENLSASPASARPAIHCIGAALGFLTGEQVAIPDWADRFYLGWLFRLFAQPRIFIPRLTRALELPWLIARYGERLPPLRDQKSQITGQRSD